MPSLSLSSSLASKIQSLPKRRTDPLWTGPSGEGPNGGVTQGLIGRFLACRERFRLKYVLGLAPADNWNHRLGYGNMWHVCEETLAGGVADWPLSLQLYCSKLLQQYPMQREDITKWFRVCSVQFPEYVKYWRDHPDVKSRTPLLQEQLFDVPYALPSGRTVRLRGKWDSVDLIDGGVWLAENKTKSDVDEIQLTRQMKFDLQTMTYLVALGEHQIQPKQYRLGGEGMPRGADIKGVRYNVIRRPLSGGKGSIRPHAAKSTKTKITPAESDDAFYERLRVDYLAADPSYWFFRLQVGVSAKDITEFRRQCLDPILEQMCWWYDEITGVPASATTNWEPLIRSLNFRFPFGVWNPLLEGGATEYDAMLESGSTSGLHQIDTVFPELE